MPHTTALAPVRKASGGAYEVTEHLIPACFESMSKQWHRLRRAVLQVYARAVALRREANVHFGGKIEARRPREQNPIRPFNLEHLADRELVTILVAFVKPSADARFEKDILGACSVIGVFADVIGPVGRQNLDRAQAARS
jgi:hypothetical protein